MDKIRFFKIAFIVFTLLIALNVSVGLSKARADLVYANEKYGFEVQLTDDLIQEVEIVEGPEGMVLFCLKEARLDSQVESDEQIGVVGRLEIYEKKLVSKDNLEEFEDMYSFNYLGENEDYYFGWSHSTDIQIFPDGSEDLEERFEVMEKRFGESMQSFEIK